MKVGVLLPTFEVGAKRAFAAAARASATGFDGVFAYDHLWPMGSPQRPALAPFPVLASVGARYPSLCLGPLVARVGLVSTDHLVTAFRTLEALAPHRVLAAIGTGDRLSAQENAAYGVPELDATARRQLLGETARALVPIMSVWIGAGAPATNALAREVGATVNLWNASAASVREAAQDGPVSWAGPAPASEVTSRLLDDLASAGATWAVFGDGVDADVVAGWRSAN